MADAGNEMSARCQRLIAKLLALKGPWLGDGVHESIRREDLRAALSDPSPAVQEDRAARPDAAAAAAAAPRRDAVTLTARQLREALELVNPDGPDAGEDQLDAEVTISWSEQTRDDDGQLQPPGYVAWLTEYPEEGCIPLDAALASTAEPRHG